MLAESFNATASQLEQLVGAQRGVRRRRVAPAAHTARRAAAAAREPRGRGERHQPQRISTARSPRCDGSRDLVDGLLVLTRAEQATSAPAPIDVDDGHRRSAATPWDAFAAERYVRIDVAGRRAARRARDARRLEQVVDNLLEQRARGRAAAQLRCGSSPADHDDWVELRVSDEGPGMTADERARAFDRFWQSAAARRDGRPNGHFGLGLAIVRELVVADGGDVAAGAVAVGLGSRSSCACVRVTRPDEPTRAALAVPALHDLRVTDACPLDQVLRA